MTSLKTYGRIANWVLAEGALGAGNILRRLTDPVERKPIPNAQWWQKPCLGIQYQIEFRPGMDWERDFVEFNRSMSDENGNLKFNGPFCKVDKWIELSKAAGADYHMMESKWHDGICFFDTKLSSWKTPVDYADQFAQQSRDAGIPFMFYYSTVFDHNPMFDSIQPNPHHTASYLTLEPQPVYEEYLRGHYREIMEKYRPDGMWFDWYWPDRATEITVEFFKTNYPNAVIAFNGSNYFKRSYRRLHYTSGEAHDLDGPHIRVSRTPEGVLLPVFSSTWKWSALNRQILAHPSEIIGPAGKWWSDPTLRDDPNDLLRMAAMTMASGSKFCTGAAEQLGGGIYPDQITQLKLLGDWYIPRKEIFATSVPLRYRGSEPSWIKVAPSSFKTIACRQGDDTIVHLINMHGATKPVKIQLDAKNVEGLKQVVIEPSGKELPFVKSGIKINITIRKDIDLVDIILRFKK